VINACASGGMACGGSSNNGGVKNEIIGKMAAAAQNGVSRLVT